MYCVVDPVNFVENNCAKFVELFLQTPCNQLSLSAVEKYGPRSLAHKGLKTKNALLVSNNTVVDNYDQPCAWIPRG